MHLRITLILAACLLWGCRQPPPTPTATATPLIIPSTTPELGVDFVTVARPTTVVRQVTPTPLSTATPAPTATPIIYLIQEGDTLLGLAIQNGTTVEAIEALNPGVQPNLLQIGQAIILPPQEPEAFLGVAPIAIPVSIAVKSVELYQTPLGGAWLMGDVVNDGEFSAENVQVAITLRDVENRPVATAAAWVYPTLLLPGERGGFAILLPQLPESVGAPEASIVAGATTGQLGNRYLSLDVPDIEAEFNADEAILTGAVQNSGESAAVQVRLVVLLYDAQGRMTGLVQWQAEGPLAAGSATPFTLSIAPPGGVATTFYVNVEALTPLEE